MTCQHIIHTTPFRVPGRSFLLAKLLVEVKPRNKVWPRSLVLRAISTEEKQNQEARPKSSIIAMHLYAPTRPDASWQLSATSAPSHTPPRQRCTNTSRHSMQRASSHMLSDASAGDPRAGKL